MAKILFKSLEVEELLPTQESDENLAKYIMNHTVSLLKGQVKIEVPKKENVELNAKLSNGRQLTDEEFLEMQTTTEQVPVLVTDETILYNELVKAFPNEDGARIASMVALMLAQSTKDGTFERLKEVIK